MINDKQRRRRINRSNNEIENEIGLLIRNPSKNNLTTPAPSSGNFKAAGTYPYRYSSASISSNNSFSSSHDNDSSKPPLYPRSPKRKVKNPFSKQTYYSVLNSPPCLLIRSVLLIVASMLVMYIFFRLSLTIGSITENRAKTKSQPTQSISSTNGQNQNVNMKRPHGFFRGNNDQKHLFLNDISINDQNEEELILKTLSYAMKRSIDNRLWPIRLMDESTSFDLLSHPTQDDIHLPVPTFYVSDMDHEHYQNTPTNTILGNTKPLSESVLKSFGTFIKIDDKYGKSPAIIYSHNVGKHSSNMYKTIFIGMVCYNGSLCLETLKSIFDHAKYPQRLRIGVVEELDMKTEDSLIIKLSSICNNNMNAPSISELCKYADNIDMLPFDSKYSVGFTLPRHILNRMYRNEYYYLQIDPQVEFVRDWDEDIISQFESTGNEMAVLSTYLSERKSNYWNAIQKKLEVDSKTTFYSQYVICNAMYVGYGRDRTLQYPFEEQTQRISKFDQGQDYMPLLHPFWTSTFSFSRGHFALVVPYDPYIPFVDVQNEDLSMTLRAFTNGYDFYVPYRSVCFFKSYRKEEEQKYDSIDNNLEEKENVDVDSEQDLLNKRIYDNRIPLMSDISKFKEKSMERLFNIIGMNTNNKYGNNIPSWNVLEVERFGIGKTRTLEKFFSCFGIHVNERITERKLCDFVTSSMMHNSFLKHLRPDGLGINYDDIDFRFHELIRIHDGYQN